MFSKKLKAPLTSIHHPYDPAPQQMTLFPEEKPGVSLERMKIKTLLKAFYKSAESSFTHTKAAERAG